MDISKLLKYTYLDIIPDDIKVLIWYKLLDAGAYDFQFTLISTIVRRATDKEHVILNYLKSRYATWYDIIINEEDITIDENYLRSTYKLYFMNKYYLVYLVLTRNFKLMEITSSFNFIHTLPKILNSYLSADRYHQAGQYTHNIYGRYILKRELPWLYSKIRHIDISSIKRWISFQEYDIRNLQIDYNGQTWLQFCGSLNRYLENVGNVMSCQVLKTGTVPTDYIHPTGMKYTMGAYVGLIDYALLLNPEFDLRMQGINVTSYMLFSTFILDYRLCEQVAGIIPSDILTKFIEYSVDRIDDDEYEDDEYFGYMDFVKFMIEFNK